MGLHTPIETHGPPPSFGAEILDLRHFSSQHLRPLLENETRLWAEQMSWDYRSSADMILRYVDSKILPGYAAVENGRIGGYAFFVYEGTKGVIGDLYADGSIRLSAESAENAESGESAASGAAGETVEDVDFGGTPETVESRLATHVIETLQRSPGIQRIEAQLLPHASGALAGPFLQEGFRQYPRLFMILPITALPFAGSPMPQVADYPDIDFRRWVEHDFQPVSSVITACYRGHIDSEINDQYRSLNGSLRFLNNIVRFPGCGVFDAHSSFVAVHRPTRSIAGLLLCSRVRDDVGHVTQVCVLPEHRGRHIAESLIGLCTQELRTRNFTALSLTVTEANHKAVDLYRRLGFSIRRRFDAFVWES